MWSSLIKLVCNYPQGGLPMVSSQVFVVVNVLITLSTKRIGFGWDLRQMMNSVLLPICVSWTTHMAKIQRILGAYCFQTWWRQRRREGLEWCSCNKQSSPLVFLPFWSRVVQPRGRAIITLGNKIRVTIQTTREKITYVTVRFVFFLLILAPSPKKNGDFDVKTCPDRPRKTPFPSWV